ncbi:MAG: hypothetical protein JW725_04985 [Candidatus Babeliaceae bacterium]|nr:hypothetical protein [Candidatus Babeliaceae bacterium]
MIKLVNKETRQELGFLSEEDFAILQRELEVENPEDTDYYINKDTVEFMVEQGISQTIIDLLNKALNGAEEVDIEWIK